MQALILGLRSMGTHSAIIIMAPLSVPEAPMPATTRPAINIFEEVATAHTSEPISNIPKKLRNVH